MKKNILLVVDTQYDFMVSDGALYVPGAEDIIVPLIKYVNNISTDDFHLVYSTMDSHTEAAYSVSEEAKQFPIHCVVGTLGIENIINLEGIMGILPVFIQCKSVFDMWAPPTNGGKSWVYEAYCSDDEPAPLEDFWKDAKKITNEVYVVGVATDVCVKYAVVGLLERGFKVAVVDALTRGIESNSCNSPDLAEYINTKQLRFIAE